VVALGASTGGPSALHQLLRAVKKDFPATVFVTQHISEGFGKGCVDWLDRSSPLEVKVADQQEVVREGVVYFAPDRGVMEAIGKRRVGVREAKSSEERFNIDCMMKSVAAAYGNKVVGVLLTGMGNDGVEGLRSIKKMGGRTVVQDEATSIVFGMPRAAIEAGVADEVLPLGEILPAVMRLLTVKP
jgi:two-component system chemotaxis response regulator CheB